MPPKKTSQWAKPKRKWTSDQKNLDCSICACFVIFITMTICLNLVVILCLDVQKPFIMPTHNSPDSCFYHGYEMCTTKQGHCTQNQDQCIFPTQKQDCTYMKHEIYWQYAQYKQQYKNKKRFRPIKVKDREKIKKILQTYCAQPAVALYNTLDSRLFWPMIFMELALTIVTLKIMSPQLNVFLKNVSK